MEVESIMDPMVLESNIDPMDMNKLPKKAKVDSCMDPMDMNKLPKRAKVESCMDPMDMNKLPKRAKVEEIDMSNLPEAETKLEETNMSNLREAEAFSIFLDYLSIEDVARLSCTSKKWEKICLSAHFMITDSESDKKFAKGEEFMNNLVSFLSRRQRRGTATVSIWCYPEEPSDYTFWLRSWWNEETKASCINISLYASERGDISEEAKTLLLSNIVSDTEDLVIASAAIQMLHKKNWLPFKFNKLQSVALAADAFFNLTVPIAVPFLQGLPVTVKKLDIGLALQDAFVPHCDLNFWESNEFSFLNGLEAVQMFSFRVKGNADVIVEWLLRNAKKLRKITIMPGYLTLTRDDPIPRATELLRQAASCSPGASFTVTGLEMVLQL